MELLRIFRNIFRVSNIGMIIFFLLNASLIIWIFSFGGRDTMIRVGVIYFISVVIALSPFGEWMFCLISGAKKIRRLDVRNKIFPLVQKVHAKAMEKTPDFADPVVVRIVNNELTPNAFAVGRRTICVTEGLLSLPDDLIEGVLAHEMGHLAYRHTAVQTLIGGGNIFITAFLVILQLLQYALIGASSYGAMKSKSCLSGCLVGFVGGACAAAIWLWTRFCMLFLMCSSKSNEYKADRYAYEIGFGYELAEALDTIDVGGIRNSFVKSLYSSHPDKNDRIGKLQALGVTYSRY